MPLSLQELDITDLTDNVIEDLAEKCTFFGARTIGHYIELNKKDIMEIYQAAR